MHFSFFTFFSDFVIFQVVKWKFLIFHDFQCSRHIPGPRVCISHFSGFSVISSFFKSSIECFAGYNSLGRHLCSLSVCMTSAQDLLAFRASGEKSDVILIILTCFPLLLLIVFVLGMWCFDYYVMGRISFLVQLIWSSVGLLYVHGHLFV